MVNRNSGFLESWTTSLDMAEAFRPRRHLRVEAFAESALIIVPQIVLCCFVLLIRRWGTLQKRTSVDQESCPKLCAFTMSVRSFHYDMESLHRRVSTFAVIFVQIPKTLVWRSCLLGNTSVCFNTRVFQSSISPTNHCLLRWGWPVFIFIFMCVGLSVLTNTGFYAQPQSQCDCWTHRLDPCLLNHTVSGPGRPATSLSEEQGLLQCLHRATFDFCELFSNLMQFQLQNRLAL